MVPTCAGLQDRDVPLAAATVGTTSKALSLPMRSPSSVMLTQDITELEAAAELRKTVHLGITSDRDC